MDKPIKYEPVVATPLKDGELAPILTEENYLTLRRMLVSKDEGDHKIAQLSLNTCDIQHSIYWIWLLAKDRASQMVNLRTKASRAFKEKSDLFKICNMAHLVFAESLNRKNWLTAEIYARLEPEILSTLTTQCRNMFYSTEITIKDQFKDLPITKTPIQLK